MAYQSQYTGEQIDEALQIANDLSNITIGWYILGSTEKSPYDLNNLINPGNYTISYWSNGPSFPERFDGPLNVTITKIGDITYQIVKYLAVSYIRGYNEETSSYDDWDIPLEDTNVEAGPEYTGELQNNSIWIDTSNASTPVLKIYDGNKWVVVSPTDMMTTTIYDTGNLKKDLYTYITDTISNEVGDVEYLEDGKLGKKWTRHVLGGSTINDIYYANGIWSICTDDGLYYMEADSDGIVGDPIATNMIDECSCIYYANYMWVVGAGTGLWYSTDGKSYTKCTMPVNDNIASVSYCKGVWNAVTSTFPYYSTDGITWSKGILSHPLSAYFYCIYYGNGIWVAGINGNSTSSVDGGLYYSTDGKIWERCSMKNDTSTLKNSYFMSLYYGNGIWVAGSSSNTNAAATGLWYSTDGKIWAKSNITSSYFCSVEYGNGIWVAAGNSGLYYSTDGKSWTLGQSGYYMKATYAEGLWMAACADSSGIKSSRDGKSWTQEYYGYICSDIAYLGRHGSDNDPYWIGCAIDGTTSAALYQFTDYGINSDSSDSVNGSYISNSYSNFKYNFVYYAFNLAILGTDSNNGIVYYEFNVGWNSSSQTTGYFRSACYANDILVVGSGSKYGRDESPTGLWYSTDGKNYTQSNVTSGAFPGLWYRDGLWIAGSDTGGGLWYSTDGKTWSEIIYTYEENAITVGPTLSLCTNNELTVLGCSSGMFYSRYGKYWTEINVSGSYNYIKYCNGNFIAGNKEASQTIIYSTDGINWANTKVNDKFYDIDYLYHKYYIQTNGPLYIIKNTLDGEIADTRSNYTQLSISHDMNNIIVLGTATGLLYYTNATTSNKSNITSGSFSVVRYHNNTWMAGSADSDGVYISQAKVIPATSIAPHISDDTIHVTSEEKEKWNSSATEDELQSAISDLREQLISYAQSQATSYSGQTDTLLSQINSTLEIINSHISDDTIHPSTDLQTQWTNKADSDHTHNLDDRVKVSVDNIVGTIPVDLIDRSALERCTTVDDEDSRLALTIDTIQNGDQVYVKDTKTFYFVIDDSKLGTEDAFKPFWTDSIKLSFENIENTPTTLADYGITNTYTKDQTDSMISEVNTKVEEANSSLDDFPDLSGTDFDDIMSKITELSTLDQNVVNAATNIKMALYTAASGGNLVGYIDKDYKFYKTHNATETSTAPNSTLVYHNGVFVGYFHSDGTFYRVNEIIDRSSENTNGSWFGYYDSSATWVDVEKDEVTKTAIYDAESGGNLIGYIGSDGNYYSTGGGNN